MSEENRKDPERIRENRRGLALGREGVLNSYTSAKRMVEVYSRPLTVLLTIMSSAFTVLENVVAVAILALLIVILLTVRCDSYHVDFMPEDWKKVGEGEWEYIHELAYGFNNAPCSVLMKTDNHFFKEVGVEIKYSDDNKMIVLCMNGDEGMEGRLTIGSPRGF